MRVEFIRTCWSCRSEWPTYLRQFAWWSNKCKLCRSHGPAFALEVNRRWWRKVNALMESPR